MKKNLLLILFLPSAILSGQTKKVLLEEYTGAYCGQCPLGTHYTDSMLALYPDLVAVALHAYSIPDAMDFPQIDTLFDTYSQGAPLGAVDRICTGSSSPLTAVFVNQWNARIQQRLTVVAPLAISIVPSWNSSTRNITALVNINILSNMVAGDYRLSMYVVEDSVSGTGPGYDQENFYDADASSPFFGMGNPIVGFIHRHVARALLPSSWGLQGLIPSAPVTGQNFNYTFNYMLPLSYNENRVHLVAFVNKFTSNHMGDEVLNVSEEKLLQSPSDVPGNIFSANEAAVYPNPLSNQVTLKFSNAVIDADFIMYDSHGKKIKTIENVSGNALMVNLENFDDGIYFYKVFERGKIICTGKVIAQ